MAGGRSTSVNTSFTGAGRLGVSAGSAAAKVVHSANVAATKARVYMEHQIKDSESIIDGSDGIEEVMKTSENIIKEIGLDSAAESPPTSRCVRPRPATASRSRSSTTAEAATRR